MKRGTNLKRCLVCGDGGYWLKYFQKGHVSRLFSPEGQGPTMDTSPTGIFHMYRKCKEWHKKGKNSHTVTDAHLYKTEISKQQGGDK